MYADDLSIRPVTDVGGVAPVAPVAPVRRDTPSTGGPVSTQHGKAAAETQGNLPAAYAAFAIDKDTHDVVIQVRDAKTHAVISQYPYAQVEAMARELKEYVDVLAKRHAAVRTLEARS